LNFDLDLHAFQKLLFFTFRDLLQRLKKTVFFKTTPFAVKKKILRKFAEIENYF